MGVNNMDFAEEAHVLASRSGPVGWLRLNRPKALNSLTLDMVRRINASLDIFEGDPGVAAVVLTGEGERGLCAGGDIRAIYESGRAGTKLAETFWREEYLLDARIHNFPKPFICVMDGLVMGGGVGISAHASHRVVTERSRLAMPETGIGYFPDVGASWLLSRGPGEFGTYLGLTGEQIGAADAIDVGLADFFVPSEQLGALTEALCERIQLSSQEIARVSQQFAKVAPLSPMAVSRPDIDRLFAFDSMEEILAALEADGTEFSRKTLASLLTRSPISLKLTLRLLRLGRQAASLEDCLERELVASVRMLSMPDFHEGIRAAIIDKDRNPKWAHDSVTGVSDAAIDFCIAADESNAPLFGKQEN